MPCLKYIQGKGKLRKHSGIFLTANGYMPVRRLTISTFFLFAATGVDAQSSFNKHISWWPAYYLKYAINNKWTLSADIQARNFDKELLVGLIAVRSGISYQINNQWSAAAGNAWFHQRQLTASKQKSVTDELRLWEEIKHGLKLNKWQLINQFRTEQRHTINQEGIAFRLRYRLSAEHEMGEKWKALIGNELMWQATKEKKDWDQNRTWVGGEYAFNKKNQVQLLLMNWWQFSAHTYQPVVRINFIQSIKLKS